MNDAVRKDSARQDKPPAASAAPAAKSAHAAKSASSGTSRVQPGAFAAASVLFFLSGALGLGYELVWIRKAVLIVGASQIALSTVLTAFFLGLGCGSYVVGRWVRSRRRSPLFVYGLFEVAIGLFALAFPWLFEGVERAYAALYPLAASWPASLLFLRFGLLFVLFLIPTFFMGGTLPLLLDGLVERDASIGPRTSFLYGLNILGAVAGVLATCYFAIPILGMNGTSLAGGAGNLAIGAAALAVFARAAPVHDEPAPATLDRFFPIAAFASGLLAIGYQIAWARYFTLFQITTVYLTAVLLAVYLLALSAGSFLLGPLLRAGAKPLPLLSVVQALAPVAALGTLYWWRAAEHGVSLLGVLSETGEVVASRTLELDWSYRYHWRLLGETLDAILAAPLFQVALVVFLPVALLGLGLPAIIAAAARHSAGLREVSGRLVFWNTLGSSAGGFLAGYAVLPLLGLHWTLFALGVGSIALSAAAAWKSGAAAAPAPASRRERRHGRQEAPAFSRLLILPAVSLAVVAALSAFRENVSLHTVKRHGYGRQVGYSPDESQDAARPRMKLAEVREGPLNSSFVFDDAESTQMGTGNVCLAVLYKNQPSTQAIQGHLPCLFYPGKGAPERCLGICLGSGQSFGALLLHPIRQLDVVDISSEIIDLSLRWFGGYQHELGRDPRVKFHLDDGRHFVERAADASYDVVSMEPPPPTADGVCSLYSLEFYREVARVLRPGAVFMQWLPLYRITPLDARGIIKTQAEVFPETFVFKVGNDDFMVVSYPKRPLFDCEALRARCRIFEGERMVKGMRWNQSCRHELASFEGVLSLLIMGPEDVRRLPAPVVYRDDDQILSYSSGDRWLLRRYEGPALSPLSFAALTISGFESLAGYFDPPLSTELAAQLGTERAASLEFFHVPDPMKIAAAAARSQSAASPHQRAAHALSLAQAYDGMLAKEQAYTWLEKALQMDPVAGGADGAKLARGIVANRLAVYRDIAESWVARLRQKFPGSPLVAAMEEELAAFAAREAKGKSGYLLGG